MNTKTDVKIYVVSHDMNWNNDEFDLIPLRVGQQAIDNKYLGMTDILRDGSMLLNKRWSELSGIYKVWRDGPKSEVVGFYHYRRFLNFSDKEYQEPWNEISPDALRSHAANLVPLDLPEVAQKSLFITGVPHRLEFFVPEWYAKCHIYDDYELMITTVLELAPFLTTQVNLQRKRNFMYANNIFITSWKEFDDLCSYWFLILKTIAKKIDWPRGLGDYQDRDISFLSERFFDLWLNFKKSKGSSIIERPILFVRS